MLGTPELDAGFQVGSHKSGVKGQNPLPRPAGHAALDAAQDKGGFLGCKHTLVACAELLIHQYPQVLLLRAALEPLSTQPGLVFEKFGFLPNYFMATSHLLLPEEGGGVHQGRFNPSEVFDP